MKKYRLTIYPDMDFNQNKYKEVEFDTLKEMLAAYNTTTDTLLFIQDDLNIMKDTSNMFILEELVGGVYEEVDETDLLIFDEWIGVHYEKIFY